MNKDLERGNVRLKNFIGELTIANDAMMKVFVREEKNECCDNDESGIQPAQISWNNRSI